MQWVEKHLTTHQLFHAPHKWFWAVILSPLHAGELHYKRRYHLTFVHAKKLFFFDMTLLCSIGVLIAGTVLWFQYDPTVTEDISLTIDATTDRISAGDLVSYTIHYRNGSEKVLHDPTVFLHLPSGFVIQKTHPEAAFNATSQTFTLPPLSPGASGSIHIDGWFYGSPDQDDRLLATLSYKPHDRETREQKHVSILATLRGSLIDTTLDIPDTILAEGLVPFTIRLTNRNNGGAHEIYIPLLFDEEMTLEKNTTVSHGTIRENTWHITTSTFETATLSGFLHTRTKPAVQSKDISITPSISVAGKNYPQTTVKKTVSITHPKIRSTIVWKQEARVSEPGKTIAGTITLHNIGNTPLEHISITIPLSSLIDQTELKKINSLSIEKDTTIFSYTKHANLLSLPPNTQTSLDISIPLKKLITAGEKIEFSVLPTVAARVPTIKESVYRVSTQSEKIKITSSLSLNAELRYFTPDGDQVGRGPLPPRVGKETKYWAFIHLFNRTNAVTNVMFSATLPAGVTWTGKSSVSHGKDALFNPLTRTISWTTPEMTPHSQAGIYLELAITPEMDNLGKTPQLLTNLKASAKDDFTDTLLSDNHPALDMSLPTDQEARRLGTKIE